METGEAADEFAAYLRGLKERSGRSYGWLAQRAHLSTSTLHRYCHGRAVPVEYGPVERLARLCGATPEELVGLHRRWVRADALRGVAEPSAPPASAPPAPAPEDRPEAEGGPGAGAPPGPSRAAAAPEPARTEPPLAPAAPAARGTAEAPAADRTRRWWPPVALAAAALLVTSLLTLLPGDPPGGAERAGSGPAPVGVETRRPSDPASPSAPGSRSPSPSASGSGEPGARPPAETGEAGEEEAPGGDLLTSTVRSHVWRAGCGHDYLLDRRPADVPPPPLQQDAAGWARTLSAVHGGETIVEAILRPSGPEPVVVEAVYVRVEERREPLSRAVFAMDGGCGGALTPARFEVDLDADRPVLRPRDGRDADAGADLPAPHLPYQVTADEPLALRIEATTQTCDCDWYVEVHWSSGDRTGVHRVDDAGGPFRTSGTEGRPVYGYGEGDGGGWQRRPAEAAR